MLFLIKKLMIKLIKYKINNKDKNKKCNNDDLLFSPDDNEQNHNFNISHQKKVYYQNQV